MKLLLALISISVAALATYDSHKAAKKVMRLKLRARYATIKLIQSEIKPSGNGWIHR